MEKFKEYARVAWSTCKSVVAKYPGRAATVALAIGFILGYGVGS